MRKNKVNKIESIRYNVFPYQNWHNRFIKYLIFQLYFIIKFICNLLFNIYQKCMRLLFDNPTKKLGKKNWWENIFSIIRERNRPISSEHALNLWKIARGRMEKKQIGHTILLLQWNGILYTYIQDKNCTLSKKYNWTRETVVGSWGLDL